MIDEETAGDMTIVAISMKNFASEQYAQGHVSIWMGQSELDELGPFFKDNYLPGSKTLVFDQDSVLTGGTVNEWFTLYLDTPFEYDAQSNLIIEMESLNCSTIYVWGWDTGASRNRYTYSPGLPGGASDTEVPHLQIHGSLELQRTTFGRIKALFQ